MKRVATERQWNKSLYGAKDDPEIQAMKRLQEQSELLFTIARIRKDEEQNDSSTN